MSPFAKVLLLGGCGVGLYAIYRYGLAPQLRATPTPAALPPGTPPATQRAAAGSIENPPMLLGRDKPARLHKGQRYRMWFVPADFDFLKRGLPWADLAVYQKAEDLPADWPSSMRNPQAIGVRFAAATWTGDDQALAMFPVGEPLYGISQLWPTDSKA